MRLRLLTETWILSRRSSRLCKRKLMLSETRMDRENSCEGMQLLAPKTKQIDLIFSGSPVPAPASAKVVLDNYPGKSAAVRLSCSLPDYRHSLPLPPSLASVALKPASLTGGSVASAENGRGSGRLPAGAGSLPLLQSVSMVYVLLLRCFFLFSHCTPQGA